MLDLKLKIVIVGIWPEPDFLDHRFGGIGLDLLLFLALVVEEFVEFDNPAHGWLGIWRNHHQILAHFLGPGSDLSRRVNAWLNGASCHCAYFIEIVTDKTYFRDADIAVDLKRMFGVLLSGSGGIRRKSFSQMKGVLS